MSIDDKLRIIKEQVMGQLRITIYERKLNEGDFYIKVKKEQIIKKSVYNNQFINEVVIEGVINTESGKIKQKYSKLIPGDYLITKNGEILDRYLVKNVIIGDDYTNVGD